MRVFYSLYDRLLSSKLLKMAFRKVKSAKGAAGIDGQSVHDSAAQEDENVAQLVSELRNKAYRPQPNRQVVIPKENGGERILGIPCVRDRVVQQALLNLLQPIFEPQFHPSSYAYRPGCGCHHAIAKVTKFIREHELVWVVEMDLSRQRSCPTAAGIPKSSTVASAQAQRRLVPQPPPKVILRVSHSRSGRTRIAGAVQLLTTAHQKADRGA